MLMIAHRYACQTLLSHIGDRYVWKAHDLLLNCSVVVKAESRSDASILNEYHRLQLCSHPRVVSVFDFGKGVCDLPHGQVPIDFFTQEWLSGPTLKALAGRLDGPSLLRFAREALELLAFLHSRDLTRLDLKPHHFFQTAIGWKLIDLDQAQRHQPLGAVEVHGTLSYTAPECLMGHPGSPPSDLYSLGAVLYHAMTGSPPPLEGTTLEAVHEWLLASAPPYPAGWDQTSPELVILVTSLLARTPAQRIASAEEALQLLTSASKAPGIEVTRTREPSLRESGYCSAWRSRCPLPYTPLLGRTDALNRLQTWLRDADAAKGGGGLLRSPAGGGRSRLLHAVKDMLQEEGKPVLLLTAAAWQRCDSTPIPMLLRHLHLASEGAHLSELPPFTSSIPLSLDDQDSAVAKSLVQIQTLSRQVYKKVGCLLSILVDDFEQIDPVTQQTLSQLACYLPGSGLCLLIALPEEYHVVGGLSTLPTLRLPPLSDESLRTLAEAVMGPGYFRSSAEAQQLIGDSQGLPGPFRLLMERRWRDSAATSLPSYADKSLPLLPTSLESLARSLSVLTEPFNRALAQELLAASGSPAPIDQLLSEGWLQPICRSDADEVLYRFSTENIRRELEQHLEPDLREKLHLQAATALERQQLVGASTSPGTIAHHFVQGAQPDRALSYLQRALTEARASSRWNDVARHLQSLISLTPPDTPVSVELCRQRGEALMQLGDLAAAQNAFETALKQEGHLTPARRACCLGDLGDLLVTLGKHDQAREPLTRAIALARTLPSPPPGLRHWLQRMVWIELQHEDFIAAESCLKLLQTQEAPPTLADQVDLTYLEVLVSVRAGKADASRVEQLAHALTLARQMGSLSRQSKCLNLLARMAHTRGDYPAARLFLEELLTQARASWDPGREAIASYNLATFLKDQQEPAAALEHYERAALLAERQGNFPQELKARIECIAILLDHCQLDRAEVMLERLRKLVTLDASVSPSIRIALEVFTCRLRLHRGELEELSARLEALDAENQTAGVPDLVPEILATQMALALKQQQPLRALQHFSARLDPSHQSLSPGAWQRIHALAIQAHQAFMPMNVAKQPEPVQATKPPPSPPLATGRPESDRTPESQSLPTMVTLPPGQDPQERAEQSQLPTPDWLLVLQNLLAATDDEDLLASELAALAGRLFQGRGLVFLFEGSHVLVGRGYQLETHQIDDVSSTIMEKVRESRKPFICPDVRANPLLGQLQSLRVAQVRSVLCYPILHDNACLGVIYLDHVEVGRVTADNALADVGHIAALTAGLLATALQRRRRFAGDVTRFGLIGTSTPMKRLHGRLEELANAKSKDLIVLFLGETGTGKSTIARQLHQEGARRSGPFIPINTPSINEHLFESLMMGHTRGSFTGAIADQPGWFEMAKGGTLFLDEIGDMPLAQQTRLLETLGGARRFRRLGSDRERVLDVHLFSATSRELKQEATRGLFRPELLRRISVNTCRIPPLRERGPEDIHLLACHAITVYLKEQKLLPPDAPLISLDEYVSRATRDYLYTYEWPWNVSQLENLFANEWIRTLLRSKGKKKVDLSEVKEALDLSQETSWPELHRPHVSAQSLPLNLTYEALDQWYNYQKAIYIRRMTEACAGNRSEVARRLDCTRDVVYKFLEMLAQEAAAPETRD